jgi:Ca2+/Na+ antiporter
MLSQLSKTYMGLTVIAVGNALPDGITTIALAK